MIPVNEFKIDYAQIFNAAKHYRYEFSIKNYDMDKNEVIAKLLTRRADKIIVEYMLID